MNFSAWAIRRPLPSLMLFVALCIAGLYSFKQLPVARFPDIAFPMVTVTVTLPGAAPAQLETEVTRRVENAVATLEGVKRTISSATEGQSITFIEFHLETPLEPALDDVRDAINRIRIDLPADIQEPIIAKVAVTGGTLLAYAVHAPGWHEDELSWFVDDTVSKTLFGVRGIAQVTRVGGIEREVRVDLDPAALLGYGVTAGQVSQQLARVQVERPAGQAEWGGERQVIRTVGTVMNAGELRNFPIALPDGRSVRLSALAKVVDGAADPTEAALLDGEPVVGFSMLRARGSSEVAVAQGVRNALAELATKYPGMEFEPVYSTVEEAERSYSSSMTMLWEGGALAVLVVLVFLRDWRATWISALALPLSIIPTFAVMHWFGFSLNMITLLALAVVVGILVDDAIVEVENIVRHLGMGKSPVQAATDAAQEIGLAVIATSMTLAAVFVPVAFMPGIAGKFFREFGWTAATAVLFSLLVARLLTPMIAAYQLKPQAEHPHDGKVMRWYLGWVDAALRHRARTLWLAFGLFIGSLALVPLIPATFIPVSDLGHSNLSLELPPGTTIEETTAVAEQARLALADIPELKQVYTTIGSALDLGDPGKTGVGETRKATLILDWGNPEDRHRHQKTLEHEARTRLAHLSGVRISYLSSEPGEQLQLVLSGDDPLRLSETAQAVERELRTISGLGSITSSASLLRPEVLIVPDPVRAAERGVTTDAIAEATRIATAGDYTQRMAKLNLPERQVPIRVGFSREALREPALIGQLQVMGRDGPVPLASVANISLSSGPAQIARYQRQRNVTLTAELNGRALGEVMSEVQALPSVSHLPPGISFLNAGDAEVFVELFVGFLLAMGAGIACIYAVLLLLFNNAFQPITILTAVPLCAGGAFGALLVSQNMLSLPALIGLLMLIGIASKNSILLVDYAVMAEQEHGLSQHDALVDACRKRARPVIMTTLAMSAGMAPVALGLSADSSFRAPMAIAVIGGLATSTVLSLIVVPAAYTVMDDLHTRLGRWKGQGGMA
ncbi:MAG TPA: efflux RND transporter permease subunit [Chiayiivirga sp.]|nr:efflux RND transporter permease subunit [Chiayiivirga sp.]